jgi:prolyl 4-hydroxylase
LARAEAAGKACPLAKGGRKGGMELQQAFAALAARDGIEAAVAMVAGRAAAGDPAALLATGMWRLWGMHGPRDLKAGYAAIAAAADAGLEAAACAQIALRMNGTGIAADRNAALALLHAWEARSDALAAQSALIADWGGAGDTVRHAEAPRVMTIAAFAPKAVCRHLIERAAPRLQPSFVVDPATGARRSHPVRSSTGANFAPVDEDAVIAELHHRIAQASTTDVAAGEPLHILSYEPGQQYRPHMDALPGVANQRRTTAILYLNDDFEGGATVFPARGVSIVPRTGMLLIFDNVDDRGVADRASEHAGEPVAQGRKWVATRWIRSTRCHPWEPDTMR